MKYKHCLSFQSHHSKRAILYSREVFGQQYLKPCDSAKILVRGERVGMTIAYLNRAVYSHVWVTGPLHSALRFDSPFFSDQHPSHPGTDPLGKDCEQSVSPDKQTLARNSSCSFRQQNIFEEDKNLISKINLLLPIDFLLDLSFQCQQLHGFNNSLEYQSYAINFNSSGHICHDWVDVHLVFSSPFFLIHAASANWRRHPGRCMAGSSHSNRRG